MLFRALVQLFTILLATLVLGTAVIVLCPLDFSRRLFMFLARVWGRLLCWAAGVRVEVSGRAEIMPGCASVFIPNHASLLDVPALLLAIPVNFRVIAKRALFFIPVFGQALWAAGIIPIDRRNRSRAIISMGRAAGKIRRGQSVLVFAEGTRSKNGRLLPFKKGAFIMAIQSGAPIQPVVVTGSRDLLPPGKWLARSGTIRVAFLRPIPTSGLTLHDRDRLMSCVFDKMQAALAGQGHPVSGAAP
ncbi:MAG: lysophospholipid acyltransferase family protein [Acidobacteriota bacterium]